MGAQWKVQEYFIIYMTKRFMKTSPHFISNTSQKDEEGALPGSTLHGYLNKILARSCQDLGKILAKIVTRYCQELQDAMVRSYQESHVSKKNLTKKPNMARKILLRSPIWREKSY